MKRWLVVPLAFGLVVMGLAALAGPASATRHRTSTIKMTRVHSVPASRVAGKHFADTPAGRMIASRGYLPQHPSTFKYRLPPAAVAGSDATPNITAPTVIRGWNGVNDTGVTPPDTTGAAGESSFIEAINRQFAIYTRTGTLTTSKGMKPFVGAPDSFNTDPQIIWDPGTNAFYYVLLNYNNNTLYYGWSKTSNPSTLTSSSWCQFSFANYGAATELPDYPKLGDTTNFGVVGVNVYNANTLAFKRSEVFMFKKPALGSTSTCTTPGTWQSGALTDGGGFDAFTPVPAVQTDFNALGYIVSATLDLGATFPECGDELSIFEVTGTVSPVVSSATNQSVPEFDLPYLVPQKGTSAYLDPLDCRLTQAMSGIDPNAVSTSPGEIWTQHAVSDPISGNPTQVNWYEIHGIGGLDQSGTVVGSSTFAFNGSISSDRSVPQSSAAQFGGAMVLGFDTSSSSQYTTIRMVSKIGAGAQSSWVTVKSSKGYNRDFGCFNYPPRVCRWGDYSGASADPRTSTGTNGHVWLANEYNVASANNSDVDARTHIWEASP